MRKTNRLTKDEQKKFIERSKGRQRGRRWAVWSASCVLAITTRLPTAVTHTHTLTQQTKCNFSNPFAPTHPPTHPLIQTSPLINDCFLECEYCQSFPPTFFLLLSSLLSFTLSITITSDNEALDIYVQIQTIPFP